MCRCTQSGSVTVSHREHIEQRVRDSSDCAQDLGRTSCEICVRADGGVHVYRAERAIQYYAQYLVCSCVDAGGK